MVRAADVAEGLGLRRSGRLWCGECPACGYRDAFTVSERDGHTLVRCHACCDQAAVIDVLRARGLWQGSGRHNRLARHEIRRTETRPDCNGERTGAALRIWRATTPAPGTQVEAYLGSRGIGIAPPPSIRFHAGLKHPSGNFWPAMVALVTHGIDDVPLGVLRTFLMPDGSHKACPSSGHF